MKKAIGMIVSIILTLSLCACSWLQNLSYNAEVEKALGALETGWTDFYAEEKTGDGYVQVKNTRIIRFNDNMAQPWEDAKYLVEFALYTDYFNDAPYYADAGFMDTVLIYEDGRAELQKTSPLYVYRAKNYKLDVVEEVIDLGDAYNRTWNLKK